MAHDVFVHDGKGYTPNGSIGPCDQPLADEMNSAHDAQLLDAWKTQPDTFVGYYDDAKRTVTTWNGSNIGTIVESRVYRHNFGGHMIAIKMRGTNGAMYHGRASFDWGTIIRLRRVKR